MRPGDLPVRSDPHRVAGRVTRIPAHIADPPSLRHEDRNSAT